MNDQEIMVIINDNHYNHKSYNYLFMIDKAIRVIPNVLSWIFNFKKLGKRIYSKSIIYLKVDMQDMNLDVICLDTLFNAGTSMGCVGPKSAISVRDDQTFLDLSVQQIQVQTFISLQFLSSQYQWPIISSCD